MSVSTLHTFTGKDAVRVVDIRDVAESTYVLRMERNGMAFRPGQTVLLGAAESTDIREYSIYSSVNRRI